MEGSKHGEKLVDGVVLKYLCQPCPECQGKLKAAEELAKLIQELKRELAEMDTPWTNRLVKLIASHQATWENAGKGD